MINLLVQFQYEAGPGPDGEPISGHGATSVTAEREPETPEEFYAVAQAIGRMEHPNIPGRFTSIRVLQVAVLDAVIDDSDTVLEGTIVE